MTVKTCTSVYGLSQEEILDSLDLQELLEDPTLSEEDDPDTRELLRVLAKLKTEHGDEGWEYGIIFIRDSYFTDYARDLADDLGLVNGDASWPMTCIDWDQAAEELRGDYSVTTIGHVTYWYQEA